MAIAGGATTFETKKTKTKINKKMDESWPMYNEGIA
jgi:hypothetical protein